jgi:PleD family two-component response regulator
MQYISSKNSLTERKENENVIEFKPVNDLHIEKKSKFTSTNTIKSFPQTHTNQTIVIIDNNPTFIDKFNTLLANKGYKIVVIKEPMSGMSRLMEEKPSLILLDTQMPTVDGYSVCKFLRTTPLFSKIPIVLLTRYNSASETDYAKFVGANDVLCKPIKYKELILTIKRLLPHDFSSYKLNNSVDLMVASS